MLADLADVLDFIEMDDPLRRSVFFLGEVVDGLALETEPAALPLGPGGSALFHEPAFFGDLPSVGPLALGDVLAPVRHL